MSMTRTALVTGAASGIGLAIARRLLAAGHQVVLADRNEQVRAVARGLGPQASAEVIDLALDAQVVALAEAVKQRWGGVDILVNNAGISPKHLGRPFTLPDITTPDWEATLKVNLTAPFVLCRELVPLMQSRGWGRVINIASRAGRTFVGPVSLQYSASKAGLIGMTRQLAGTYAAHGITANCIAPGRIETPLSSTSAPELIQQAVAGIPVGRLGTPDEIAAVAAFLASDGAAFVTGICVDANGGAFMAS
ncbi:MAG: SDR family NAD(P)-dependent oxidoreductase [Burkholderiales bacterium]